ncbi:MAG: ATP-grasp fold amidoligase family protein [Candidatus Zapsychrus exili]|nr:ATP-grasp fold amidoligase family protein [Candidatus Zapsychrus exili]
MSLKKTLKKIYKNPSILLLHLIQTAPFRLLSDKLYLNIRYRLRVKRKLNLKNPETFNEKLQWLKINDRNPIYPEIVDKNTVREIIADKVGDKYLVPIIGKWDNAKDINFDKLPEQFVLKCTHDSASSVICGDKRKLNIEKTRKYLNRKLKQNYYYIAREWPYKNLERKIICEKYLTDGSEVGLRDYKIFCFHGEIKFIRVNYMTQTGQRKKMYDTNWNMIEDTMNFVPDDKVIDKPKDLAKMVEIAEILSKDFIHLRVDFYLAENKIYLGELTLYHGSGSNWFRTIEIEKKLGSYINLDSLKEVI